MGVTVEYPWGFKCTWLDSVYSVVFEIGHSSMSSSMLLIFSCVSNEESDSSLDGGPVEPPNHEEMAPLLAPLLVLRSICRLKRSVSFILLSASLPLSSREAGGWWAG